MVAEKIPMLLQTLHFVDFNATLRKEPLVKFFTEQNQKCLMAGCSDTPSKIKIVTIQ